MKVFSFKKIWASALALTMGCFFAANTGAAETSETAEQPVSNVMLYYGSVEKVMTDETGVTTALLLSSERYGEYIMKLSDETVWIDSGAQEKSDPAAVAEGESLYVFHSAAATLSLPPQSAAYAVVRNIPMDVGCAMYMVVDDVIADGQTYQVTANRGTSVFYMDAETTYQAYGAEESVTADQVQPGSRVMVWYRYTGFCISSKEAYHVMLLPGKNEICTRGEFLTMLYKQAGSPDITGTPSFADVSEDMDVYPAVVWAVQEQLLMGYSSDRCGMEDPLLREQAYTILWRQAHAPRLMDGSGLNAYEDVSALSSYAQAACMWAHQKDFLDTKQESALRPVQSLTISEVKAILSAFAALQ